MSTCTPNNNLRQPSPDAELHRHLGIRMRFKQDLCTCAVTLLACNMKRCRVILAVGCADVSVSSDQRLETRHMPTLARKIGRARARNSTRSQQQLQAIAMPCACSSDTSAASSLCLSGAGAARNMRDVAATAPAPATITSDPMPVEPSMQTGAASNEPSLRSAAAGATSGVVPNSSLWARTNSSSFRR